MSVQLLLEFAAMMRELRDVVLVLGQLLHEVVSGHLQLGQPGFQTLDDLSFVLFDVYDLRGLVRLELFQENIFLGSELDEGSIEGMQLLLEVEVILMHFIALQDDFAVSRAIRDRFSELLNLLLLELLGFFSGFEPSFGVSQSFVEGFIFFSELND